MFVLQKHSNNKKKLCYILIILCILAVIYLLFFREGDKEVVTLYPNYSEFKIKASGEQNLVQNLNADKTIYESFGQVGSQKASKINFSPAPEAPLFVEKNIIEEDVFNIIPKEENSNLVNNSKLNVESVWDALEAEESPEAVNSRTKSNSLKITNLMDKALHEGNAKKHQVKYFIQLAYSRSQGEALNAWNRINSLNKKYLKNFTHNIDKQKRGGSIFYELYLGPFNNFREAKHLCTKLKLEKHKCLVIKK